MENMNIPYDKTEILVVNNIPYTIVFFVFM